MREQESHTGSLMAGILGLSLLGGVLIAYLWETLNRVLSLHFDPVRVLISVPVLLVFLLLLRFIARRVEAWWEEHDRTTSNAGRP